MKRITSVLALAGAALYVLLGLPGTAFAYTEPIRPQSGVPVVTPVVERVPAAAAAAAGWSPSVVLAVGLLIVLAVALVAASRRLTRQRRQTRTPAMST